MLDWWTALPLMKQFFLVVAVPSTVVLLIQSIMTFAGLGDSHDMDAGNGDGNGFDGSSHGFDGNAHGFDGGSHGFDGSDSHDAPLLHDGLGAHDAAMSVDSGDVQDSSGDVHDGGHHTGIDGFRFFTLRGIIAFLSVFGWTGSALIDTSEPVMTFAIAFMSGLAAMTLVGLAFYGILKLQSKGNLDYRYSIGTQGEVYLPIPAAREGMGKVNVVFQERLVEADAVTDNAEKLPTGTRIRVTGLLGNNVLLVSKEWHGYETTQSLQPKG